MEFATTALNPNFPPRIGLAGGLPPSDPGYDKRSWMGITAIVTHDEGESPQDTPDHFTSLYEGDAPQTASYPINVRGDVDVPGELVSPDFLQMFAGRNTVAQSSGSGRLELAESLVQPAHPLTARVYVNRVWQWLFGNGLVATPDDFGHLGDQPSHPELLDSIAAEFVQEGWSTKKLIRRLVLSETFRQSGAASAAARQRDPANRLLHHYPTRRLEAEAIRDAMLAVSGRLDRTLYGRPIDPLRSAELDRWAAALHDFAADGSPKLMTDEVAWRRLSHLFFNAKEFIYYR